MANEFVEILSQSTNKQLKDAIGGLDQIIQRINKINSTGQGATLPSQFAANSRNAAAAMNQINAARQRSVQAIERERLAEIRLQQQRERAFDRFERQHQREQQRLSTQENAYNQLQSKIKALLPEYQNLATRQEIGERLTEAETRRYQELQDEINQYQRALVAVDATIGRHQRNVGNYASGFNPLNNSINQLTREMPAFANSVQTGFMAISNNLPAFFEAMQGIVRENRRLQAQGEPTRNVFRQLAAAIFSVGTLLSVGVTLLTIYGDEIVAAFSGSTAIGEKFKETVEGINATYTEQAVKLEVVRDALSDTNISQSNLNKALKIAEQNGISLNAIEQARKGNLAAITREIDKQIISSIKKAKADKIVQSIAENEIELSKAQAQAEKVKNKWYEIGLKAVSKVITLGQGEISIYQNKINKNKELQEQNEEYYKMLKELGLEALLDEEKGLKSKDIQVEKLRDFNATIAELNRTRLENEASIQQRIFNDEEQNLERRELAYREYHNIQRQLADNALKESIRVNNLEANAEIKTIEERIRKGETKERAARAAIASIRKDAETKNLIAYENYAEALRQIDLSMIDSMKGVADAINSQNIKTQISQTDLRITEDYVSQLQKLNKENAHYRDVEKAARQYAIANRDISRASVQQEINDIKLELDSIKDVEDAVQRRIVLSGQLAQKQKELSNIEKEEAEEQGAAIKKLQQATENYLNSFKSEVFSEFGLKIIDDLTKIEENGKSAFTNLMDGAKKLGKEFQTVFVTITEVAQQAYNFLNEQNNARFQLEYESLERQTQIRRSFAEGNAAQEAEVQRQYDEERRKIQIAELKAKKEQAIFNAVINTAQGVTAALPNFALAAIVGALGAAQIALISSQQIPAFKDGVRGFGGGMAIVGDGGRSEIVTTPSGDVWRTPATDTLVNLPKGSNVFKSDLDFIRNSGAMFGGMPHVRQGEGNNLNMAMLEQLLAGSATNIISFDGKGFTKKIHTGHSSREAMNNRITMTGRTYRN